MKKSRLTILTFISISILSGAAVFAEPVAPFEVDSGLKLHDQLEGSAKIDALVQGKLQEHNVKPALLSSDEVFLRRVHISTTGKLPPAWLVNRFDREKDPAKRAKLIDRLIESDEFAEYQSMKWCDILRVKAEFPINLWPNGVQAYHRYIYEMVKTNKAYDRFAREMLTSSGSNFRVPAVNFYRGIQGTEPSAISRAVALTFMGTRLDKWPGTKVKEFEAFFSHIAFKGTAEWKEVIVYPSPQPRDTFEATLPDGGKVAITPNQDPRGVFADWLIRADNKWFARCIVNRIWYWLMGRGIIHEPDDIGPDNHPSNPELLAWLENELIGSGYDLKHIYRIILNSYTYQQSSIPQTDLPHAEKLFAYYPVRRLEAEVLIDAICDITGTSEKYSSPIPEPFTFVPAENRTVELADASITSQFLEMFGRPSRDTGLISERNNEISQAQSLHMLNSTHIQNKIDNGWRIKTIQRNAKNKPDKIVEQLYLNILSRKPTDKETAEAVEYFNDDEIKLNRAQAVRDVAWALLNSKEFLYQH